MKNLLAMILGATLGLAVGVPLAAIFIYTLCMYAGLVR
jgi:hypothetical protein